MRVGGKEKLMSVVEWEALAVDRTKLNPVQLVKGSGLRCFGCLNKLTSTLPFSKWPRVVTLPLDWSKIQSMQIHELSFASSFPSPLFAPIDSCESDVINLLSAFCGLSVLTFKMRSPPVNWYKVFTLSEAAGRPAFRPCFLPARPEEILRPAHWSAWPAIIHVTSLMIHCFSAKSCVPHADRNKHSCTWTSHEMWTKW